MRDTLQLKTFTLLLCSCISTFQVPASSQIAKLDAGTTSGSAYHNSELGFRYQFPNGWFVNDPATQRKAVEAGHQVGWIDNASASHCTKGLLFVTQHPEGMPLSGFDSAVFLTAADTQCFPGLQFPTSVRDGAAIQGIAKQIMSHFTMGTVTSHSPARVRAFDNAGRVMIEISMALVISINEPARITTQNIHTAFLLMQAGHYLVVWRFASDTDYNLEKLRTTRIFFDAESGGAVEPK